MKTRKKTLAKKIAKLISVMLLIIFAALITLSMTFTRSAIIDATYRDLSVNSKANGVQVQEFMNVCQSTALSLRTLMEDAFAAEKALGASTETFQSSIYPNLKLNSAKKDLESQLIATAKNAVRHNESIIGIGIMFEPYQYSNKRESYAFYNSAGDNGEIEATDVGEYSYYGSEDYYTIANDKTGTVFTPPYVYRDMSMISAAMPIIIDGKHVGVINIDVTMDEFKKLNLDNDTYPSMGIQVVSGTGAIAFDSKTPDNIGKNIGELAFGEEGAQAASLIANSTEPFQATHTGDGGKPVCSFFYPLRAGSETWQTITTVSLAEINRDSLFTTMIQAAFCVVSLVILLVVIIRVLNKNLRPIDSIVAAAVSLAEGNLDINIDVDSNDEIGELAKTFTNTSASLRAMISDISRVLDCVAGNDLTAEPEVAYKGDFAAIRESLKNILHNLNRVMQNLNYSSQKVSGGSEQILSSAQALSQGATEQAASIQELSASIEDISTNIRENAGHAREAREESITSKEEIERCNIQMREMIKAMDEIRGKSSQIGNIIKTVEDIAFQTNILALNAAVEAARAGMAGKGFAVVADEVRNLAGKSAEAVKDTTGLIEETIHAVENGAQIAGNTAKSMAVIVEDNERVTQYMDHIAAASSQQAQSIEQITQGMEQISAVVQTTSATAEESAAASQELTGQAQVLKGLVDEFSLSDAVDAPRALPMSRLY